MLECNVTLSGSYVSPYNNNGYRFVLDDYVNFAVRSFVE